VGLLYHLVKGADRGLYSVDEVAPMQFTTAILSACTTRSGSFTALPYITAFSSYASSQQRCVRMIATMCTQYK